MGVMVSILVSPLVVRDATAALPWQESVPSRNKDRTQGGVCAMPGLEQVLKEYPYQLRDSTVTLEVGGTGFPGCVRDATAQLPWRDCLECTQEGQCRKVGSLRVSMLVSPLVVRDAAAALPWQEPVPSRNKDRTQGSVCAMPGLEQVLPLVARDAAAALPWQELAPLWNHIYYIL